MQITQFRSDINWHLDAASGCIAWTSIISSAGNPAWPSGPGRNATMRWKWTLFTAVWAYNRCRNAQKLDDWSAAITFLDRYMKGCVARVITFDGHTLCLLQWSLNRTILMLEFYIFAPAMNNLTLPTDEIKINLIRHLPHLINNKNCIMRMQFEMQLNADTCYGNLISTLIWYLFN